LLARERWLELVNKLYEMWTLIGMIGQKKTSTKEVYYYLYKKKKIYLSLDIIDRNKVNLFLIFCLDIIDFK